ncbi:DUF167 domain-containing protein [[Eubacterium] cellulosolvens]
MFIKATPNKGKTNHQILKILAKILQVPTTDLRIISGYTSKRTRNKNVGTVVW